MKQSHLFTRTRKDISHQDVSINAQLLERAGYISKLMSGVYNFLPLGLRVLNKIEQITRQEMNALDAQEILMPALQPREIWEDTGRWDSVDVLFKIKGAGDRDLCLGPTHEEVVTPLMGEFITSYKQLPTAVYQIQTKFRNEPRAKSGLLRGREFRMKDLYSFHTSDQDLDAYYKRVITAYFTIFKRCGLADKTLLTFASGGIFSKYSHEFQTLSDTGEDRVFVCTSCSIGVNSEVMDDLKSCPECNSAQLVEKKAIEVGNIFKLMTRFSQPVALTFVDQADQTHAVIMGCYGLGTSRLLATVVETLHDAKGIVWPKEIAPYQFHLISLLKDTKPGEELYQKLQQAGFEVLFDDRELGAGEKFMDADLLGMPYRLVISQKTLAQNSVEVKARTSDKAELVPLDDIHQFLKKLA